MKIGMKKTAVSTALWATLLLTMGVSISACSNDKEAAGAESGEVLAKDKVDEAAELARKNAPEAEKLDFPETAPMPAAETDATADTEAGTEIATAQDGTVATDASATSEAPATASADTEVASTDTEMAGTDATANAPASN
ncbi:hypothetical protein [Psychrobacter immobilis]|uniref:hypothetical protein n=1 Tax=Psychrobacter immobilis TaxID=498 RepID=UPI001D1030C8|nr:hypothetical protein [Psychrobacter immobilis]